jgi:hypothetical protein
MVRNIVPPGGGHFDGAFDMLLAFDLAEIEVLIPKFCLGPIVGGTHRFQGYFERCVSASIRMFGCLTHCNLSIWDSRSVN